MNQSIQRINKTTNKRILYEAVKFQLLTRSLAGLYERSNNDNNNNGRMRNMLKN